MKNKIHATCISTTSQMGCGDPAVERRTVNRGDGGSIPPTAVLKLDKIQFTSPHTCLSEEALKSVESFYLGYLLGKLNIPHKCVDV